MSYATLLFEIRDAVAIVTVNRPEKLNALNAAVIAELGDVADRMGKDPEIRGMILTGAGPKAFVAGADIGEIAAQGPVAGKARALEGQRVFRSLEQCGKPVIAAVNGFALGGGCEIAMACDVRLASETAKFGQPEVNLGIIPGYGGTQRLPRLVGTGKAKQLILTGELISAAEAHRIGLVDEVYPAAELMEKALKMAQTIASKGPVAVMTAKRCVNLGMNVDLKSALEFEHTQFGVICATDDKTEGCAAFLEKRPAAFKGQ